MVSKYRISAETRSTASLKIHPVTAEQLGLIANTQMEVEFGCAQQQVRIIYQSSLKSYELRLSHDVLTALRIPTSPEYSLKVQGNRLCIGPFIGILAAVEEKTIEYGTEYLTSFVLDYEHIGGTILVFSLEGVQTDNQMIEGMIYNPVLKEWEKGIFPYPSAMFSILEVSMTNKWAQFQGILDHFHHVLGPRMFNYPIFDKWEMYQWLHNHPQLKTYLPKTVLLKKPSDMEKMLNRYRKIYVKPIVGRLGLGVMEAIYDGQKVLIKARIQDKNYEHVFSSRKKFISYVETNLPPDTYLIQEAIDLLTVNGRIIDFRLMLIKNYTGEWSNMGLLCRYGAKHSIVSNITSGGYAQWGKTALKRILHIDGKSVNKWNRRMTDLSLQAAFELEKQGIQCGNLGFDLAIDKKKKLWLIEINNQNPDHVIAIRAGRTDKFLQARHANMCYARKLAGFPLEDR